MIIFIVMKHLLTILLLILGLGLKAQTSVYHPFPQINSYWNINKSFYCWIGIPEYITQSYSVIVSNDTTIGSETYHKLFIPYLRSDSTGCTSNSVTQGIYKGCIREDISAKKVYYVKPSFSTEKLLYDFNLQVGDTIFGELEAPTKDTVISIDSIETWGSGGGWVKRWLINSCYNIYIIEGVGSTYGLIEPSPGCAPDNMERDIMCMVCTLPTTGYYYPAITDCDMITSVNSIAKDYNVEIFPNPSNNSFQIDFKNHLFQELTISNLLGDIVLKENIRSLNKLFIKDLDNGIYILTLVDKDGKKTNRKIICSK